MAEGCCHPARSENPGVRRAPPHQSVFLTGLLDIDGATGVGYLCSLGGASNLSLQRVSEPEVPRRLIQKMRLRRGQSLRCHGFWRGDRVQVAHVEQVDGLLPGEAWRCPHFRELTAIDPVQRLCLDGPGGDRVSRVVELVTPIGLGQRGLVIAPPRTGKTLLLQRLAQAIARNQPQVQLMMLLIDERPEEVTELRRSVPGEVVASSSDRGSASHVRTAELGIARACRLAEQGRDVVVLFDSLTRLARAYDKQCGGSARTLSGGIDSQALIGPKRLFGSARKLEEAGSLTLLGTVLVDTGSRRDDVILEEFKGTGNLELVLDRQLAERRVFPAINVASSGTRKEERLMSSKEHQAFVRLRQRIASPRPAEAMERLLQLCGRYETNADLLRAFEDPAGGTLSGK